MFLTEDSFAIDLGAHTEWSELGCRFNNFLHLQNVRDLDRTVFPHFMFPWKRLLAHLRVTPTLVMFINMDTFVCGQAQKFLRVSLRNVLGLKDTRVVAQRGVDVAWRIS